MKKIWYILVIALSFFICFDREVYASDSYAKCWYSITGDTSLNTQNPVTFYIEVVNNKVTVTHEEYTMQAGGGYSGKYWTIEDLKAVPYEGMISSDGKFMCPNLYYNQLSTSSGLQKYYVSIYKNDLDSNKEIKTFKLYDSDIKNVETAPPDDPNSGYSCSYYLDDKLAVVADVNPSGEVTVDGFSSEYTYSKYQFDDSKFNNSTCPAELWVCYPYKVAGSLNSINVSTSEDPSAANTYCVNRYFKIIYKDTNLSGDEYVDVDKIITPTDDINDALADGCNSLKNTKTYKIINKIFFWIQIAAPIMVVIFGVLDFTKAMVASDNDAMKKAQSTFIKRIIVAAIIILLPVIMNLVITLYEGATGIDTCEIGE